MSEITDSEVPQATTERIQALERQLSAVYTERNRLVALAATLAGKMGLPAGEWRDSDAEPGWSTVVYFELPTGQVSWHLPDAEADRFLGKLAYYYDARWDGHTTDEKHARIDSFLQGTEP